MLIFPCHFASSKSSRLLGTSAALTNSVLYKTPTGVTRQAVSLPSASLNFEGKLAGVSGNKFRVDVFFLAQ